MISQYDDLTGKDADVQNFLKMIKEKNSEEGMEGILEKMSPTGDKVQNFLGQQQMIANLTPDYFGVPEPVREANKFMSRYTKGDFSDPEFIKNFQIISNYNKSLK